MKDEITPTDRRAALGALLDTGCAMPRTTQGSVLDTWIKTGKEHGSAHNWHALRDKAHELAGIRQRAEKDPLAEQWALLGPRGRRVLLAVAERLARGAKEHGDFDSKRDWQKEKREELLDWIVYEVVDTMGDL